MIDLQESREASQRRKMDNIGWGKSENNPSDGLTMFYKEFLKQEVMQTGRRRVIPGR